MLAGLLMAASGWTGVPPFEAAWKIGLFTGAYAFLAYLVEERRLTNPGFAGLIAGLDALVLALALAYSGLLEPLGLIVVAPVVYAVAKRGSHAAAMGPIGASALLFADGLTSGQFAPSVAILAQAAGVMITALLANQPRVVVRPRSIQQMISDLAEPGVETGTQALIDLREQYRRLSTAYKALERKSRVDRVSAQLLLARRKPGGDYGQILDGLRDVLGADGLILYTCNQKGDRMVVASGSGHVPDESKSLSFEVTGRETTHRLRASADDALAAIGDGAAAPVKPFANVLLRLRGLVVGMLTIFAESHAKLEEMRRRAEEAEQAIAHIVVDERERGRQRRRMAEAELLYELACRLDGVSTEPDLGRRTARALADTLDCGHVGVWLLDGERPILVGRAGRQVRLFEKFRFDPPGLEGWIQADLCPVLAYSTAESDLIDGTAALKLRVGSYLAVPVSEGDRHLGFITAASSGQGALGSEDARVLRDTAAEFAHALSALRDRAEGDAAPTRGLLSVSEFQRQVIELKAERACLVYIEPLHFEESEETVGRAAVEHAARQLGLLARRHAPRDAQICRKGDGSFIVLLPETDLDTAEKWANQISALAAMRSTETSDGRSKVPLAVRARVADLQAKPEEMARGAAGATQTEDTGTLTG